MTEQSENGLAKPAREAGDGMNFTIIVNGAERTAASAPDRSLLEVLRDDLGVTGPKFGCGEGACGACTVLIGRRAVTGCTMTAALLNQVAHPDDARIATALAGNVCRCCSYPRIQRAVRRAAELMEEPDLLVPVPPAAAQARLGAPVPALPWDVAARDADSFFELLTDGMVTVVEADEGGEDGGTGPAGPDAGPPVWG